MVKKILGYVLSLVGIAGFIKSTEKFSSFIPITLPEQLTKTPLQITSITIIIIGLLLIGTSKKTSRTKGNEIPIYKGKQIIGYRRD